jgi:ferric-dicitrate binding protein FerR (iron transport regulator)
MKVDSQINVTEPPSADLQAAEWVERLKDSCDRKMLQEWRDWIRQSPEHFMEYLCAVFIDLLLVSHDSNRRSQH